MIYPKRMQKLCKNDDVESWKQTMNDEIIALEDKDTFVLTELPEGVKPVGGRWVFTKMESSGLPLVAKGFSQI